MAQEIGARIRRLYAALGELKELDLSVFEPQVQDDGQNLVLRQDFRGGLTQEQIENFAHSAIHNLSNLLDHTRRWARKNGKQLSELDAMVERSFELRVIMDLSNVDKHGGESRDGGYSKVAPRLVHVDRLLRAHTVGIGLEFTPTGPKTNIQGDGVVVVSGQIVDRNGAFIGRLDQFLEKGAQAWEGLLHDWGISESSV